MSLGLASAANAQPGAADLAPGGLYLGVAGSGAYLELPETKSFIRIAQGVNPLRPVDGEDDGWGGGIEGRFGYVLPEAASALGKDLRVEIGARYFRLDADRSSTTIGSLSFFYARADGSSAIAGNTPVTSSGTLVTADLDYNEWGVDLLVRSDFGGEPLRISPFLGFTYIGSHRNDGFDFLPLLAGTQITASHELDTYYVGGALGVDTVFALGSGFVLSAEGRADLLGADTDLEARDFVAGLETTTASGSDSDFAVRAGGRVGISRDFGASAPVVIGLYGFGSWLSWSPQVVWPAGPGPPAFVTSDEQWTVGAEVGFTILF